MPDSTPLTAAEVEKLFVQRLGLRIGPETAAYVLRQMASGQARLPLGADAAVPVMGADARTGVAVRATVALTSIAAGPHA